MATYRVELRTLFLNGFTQTVSSLELSNFSCSWVLNGPGAFDGEVHLAVADSDIKNVGAREIIVYRDSTAIWGGYLQNIDVDRPGDTVRIGGVGYWERARSRRVRANVVATTNAHSLAWTLLDNSMGLSSGALGWTQGSNASSGSVTRAFCATDLPNVGDAIEAMASEGLFDFSVDVKASPSSSSVATFTTWASRGTSKVSTVEFDSSNTLSLTYAKSADGLTTVVDTIGEGQCDISVATQSANLSTYGRLEGDPVSVNTEQSAEVTSAASEQLRANKVPAWSADIVYLEGAGPPLSAYDIGDTVRISPGDALVTSFDLRVVERELQVDSNNTATITVSCEERAA